ncbi:unnamed protein product [Candidula unifasciata]|uniref:KANL2-like probable zinc-finger domain-containing protein n=1 Tax=Candidula unifasciata TaxID=100452 RepID=A0A8S3ZX33_9EUPU|nr:unnamed protein product [Candidula unifasciata]
MYEGKNIHYSSADSKLLCSFSGKLCNQRRLNGYGFCVRHILEDPTAPFKRCAYVAKSSNQMCTQAIPKHEERRYCNNHMQVLGMLPKKERKKKDKPGVVSENKLQLINSGNAKAKFSLSKDTSTPVIKPPPSAGDPDDPYAFPDAGPAENKPGDLTGVMPASCDSILGKSLQTGQGFVRSASDISSTAGFSLSGGSTIAKYYPELAEKLEKMRAKPETKVVPKSRARVSRTMNKLQTKIAQNKINEKLRKSQELNQTDSNSSPIQVSSPEHGAEFELSPSLDRVFSPVLRTYGSHGSATGSFPPNLSASRYEQLPGTQDIPPLPQVDTSFLATLAVQDSMGFQNTLNETGLSERLMAAHTPPRLPPPYPGSSTLSTPSSLASTDLPASAFSPQTNLNCVLENFSASHSPQRTTITQTGPSGPSSLSSLSFSSPHSLHPGLQTPTPPGFLSPASSSSFPSSIASNYSFPTSAGTTDSQLPSLKSVNNRLPTIPPSNINIFSMLNINPKQLSIDPATGLPQQHLLPSPNTLAAHLSLPPPPPYVPPVVPPKVAVATQQQSIPQSKIPAPVPASAPVTPKTSVPHTKLHKLTGILSEKVAKRKLKSDLAVNYYSLYAKRKISNHCLVGPFLASSDDDSEDGGVDMLPWQRDVFSASSDEEAEYDDELPNDVPMGMRPTKLSLLKTRLRRQWCQAKNAYNTNRLVQSSNNQATLALIRTARNSAACAVRALWQITHVKKSKRKLQRRLPKRKICCHKNEKEGQCQNQCLPYANHCLKHITYNINQQLFDFCTAKFANNVQCCLPSFDLRHELPLCQEHAAKTDNYQKQLALENKKKPRKKSKPPALTRPPRKGKKKKKGRYARTQNLVSQVQSSGIDSALSDVDVTTVDSGKQEESTLRVSVSPSHGSELAHAAAATAIAQVPSSVASSGFSVPISRGNKNLDHGLELEEPLSPDFDKPFELPLEQASRLLDESDFQEVVNKMPFDALDLFGKNGEPEHESEVADLSSASKARDALEKLLTGTMSEEESMQIAMLLAQNLQTDAELAHHAGLMNEIIPSTTAQGDSRLLSLGGMGMDISMTPHLLGLSVSDSSLLSMQPAGLNDSSGLGVAHMGLHSSQQQMLHPHQAGVMQHLSLTTASSMSGSYGHQDSLKMNAASFHPLQQHQVLASPATSAATMDSIPSVFTADLNAMYGHADSMSQSHLSVDHNSVLNLKHITGLDSFSVSTAKAVLRHHLSPSQPVTTNAGIKTSNVYAVSAQAGYHPDMVGVQIPLTQANLELSRSIINLEASSITQGGYSLQSLPVITVQSRSDKGVSYQSISSQLSSSKLLSSSSSEFPQTLALSTPSRAKKAKLMTSSKTSSVIAHQQMLHQSLQPQPQHGVQLQHRSQLPQQSVQHILQATAPPQTRSLAIPDASKAVRPLDKPPSSPNLPTTTAVKSHASTGQALSTRRLVLPGVETLHHRDNSKQVFTSLALSTSDSSKVKLHNSNMQLTDITRTRMSLQESLNSQHTMNSVSSTQASFTSSSYSNSKLGNTVRYSLTADSSLAPAASLTTTIRHNLLTGPSGPTTESILVTVRQPSPLESVPTTVRHTLPDTLSSPITLPSSPSLHMHPPPASSSSSSSLSSSQEIPSYSSHNKLPQSGIITQSSSLFHSDLHRPQWVPMATNITLQNGLPFVSSASRAQLSNRLHPAGKGSVKNKQSNAAAEAARISALATAAGVPVVCNQVSLPGFVQGISTTTFKTTGSS